MTLLTFQLQTLQPASPQRSLLLPHRPGGDSLPWLLSSCADDWLAPPAGLCSAAPSLFRGQPVGDRYCASVGQFFLSKYKAKRFQLHLKKTSKGRGRGGDLEANILILTTATKHTYRAANANLSRKTGDLCVIFTGCPRCSCTQWLRCRAILAAPPNQTPSPNRCLACHPGTQLPHNYPHDTTDATCDIPEPHSYT